MKKVVGYITPTLFVFWNFPFLLIMFLKTLWEWDSKHIVLFTFPLKECCDVLRGDKSDRENEYE